MSKSLRRPSLPRLVKKWQRILRLQDWQVTARYDSRANLDIEGWAEWNEATKEATLGIADPARYRVDVEAIVVHELLHLHFAAFNLTSTANSRSDRTVRGEQAVESITRGLIDLARKRT